MYKLNIDELIYQIIDEMKQKETYEFLQSLNSETVVLIAKDIGLNLSKNGRGGKIFVCGASSIAENGLRGVVKSFGMNPQRFEFCLGYQNLDKRLAELQYNPDYALIMAGPMPHSGSIKGKCGSMIAALESMEGYPKVVRLEANGKLKITKSNFRTKLQEQIDAGALTI
jgi:hypothetical protein